MPVREFGAGLVWLSCKGLCPVDSGEGCVSTERVAGVGVGDGGLLVPRLLPSGVVSMCSICCAEVPSVTGGFVDAGAADPGWLSC